MALYTAVTLTQAIADLSQRLYDAHPTATPFWDDTEKAIYIREALRVWNAMTGFWRDSFVFGLTTNQTWYDISDPADAPGTLRAMTITDDDLVTEMEYHLLEPPTGKTWTGSLQFGINDLLQAVARRRDELVALTGCTLVQTTVPAPAGRIILNDKVVDIRRVAWIPVSGQGYSNSPMWPDDSFALQAYERNYTTQAPGKPFTYRQSTEPPLSFAPNIDPAVPGSYDVLTVEAGAALDVIITSTMNVPDDWAWVIKYGALADLMGRDSVSRDPLRQKYCEMRYQQGVQVLMNNSAILAARIDNRPLDIEAVSSADQYRPRWQAETNGSPTVLLTAGLNLVAVAPAMAASLKSLTLDVVENAPVPVLPTDPIQVSRDGYDAMLDYSQHIASWKMGGAEFLQTFPLMQRFYKQCGLYNSKLAELGQFQKAISEMSQLMAQLHPVYADVKPDAGGAE